MEKQLSNASLLWCLNNRSVQFIVLGYEKSCEVYSAKMELLVKVSLPFKPYFYAVVSENGVLVFDVENRFGLIDVRKGMFTEMKAPSSTSAYKRLSVSRLLKVDDGFVFFVLNAGVRKYSYHYSSIKNRFRKVEIEMPRSFDSVDSLDGGAYFYLDDQKNIHFCSFKTAYREKRIVSEMAIKLNKELPTDYHDVFDIGCDIAYLSIQKGILILVSRDRPDTTAFYEYMKNLGSKPMDLSAFELIKHRDSGKIVLIKNGVVKRVIELDKMPFTVYSQPFSDSVLLVGHGGVLDAYSTDDLTLLTSFQSAPMKIINLPDGRMVYEINGDTYLSDSSPLAMATKKLEELKRGH